MEERCGCTARREKGGSEAKEIPEGQQAWAHVILRAEVKQKKCWRTTAKHHKQADVPRRQTSRRKKHVATHNAFLARASEAEVAMKNDKETTTS